MSYGSSTTAGTMTRSRQRHLAIVGAGVGGLAAAVALSRVGSAATVFEAAPAVRAGGGALWIFPNGVHALRSLGLGAELSAIATPVHRYRFWSWSGHRLWEMPVARFSRQYGAPLVIVERGSLLRLLFEAAERSAEVRVGCPCSGFFVEAGTVVPVFEGPHREEADRHEGPADGLIGADGFHSAIRAQLLGGSEGDPLQMAWTGTAVLDRSRWFFAPGEMASFHGRGLLFTVSTARCRPQDPEGAVRVLWFASERHSTSERRIGREQLATLLGNADRRIGELVERSEEPVGYPVRDRDPAPRWSRGPVTLLGDAAHPMTPDLGQGACQALEDAVVLAECLAREPSVERAFALYERRRLARTARVVRMSRLMTMSRLVLGSRWDVVRNVLTAAGVPRFLMHELRFVLGGEPVPFLWPALLPLR